MLGSINTKKVLEALNMAGEWEDDPSKSIIMIFGKEDGGTTTLAASVVDLIPDDKNVYVLLTEPPHNFAGPVRKHFPKEADAGRYVIPTMEVDGKVIPKPIASRADFIKWKNQLIDSRTQLSKKEDLGAVIVDALDSLRGLLFLHYLKKSPGKGTINYADADQDIINEFFIPFSFLQVPIIVVLKHKEESIWHTNDAGQLTKVEKTGKIVPTIDGEKILRWSTMRLWCTKIGTYEVTKTKGMVDRGEVLKFGFSKNSKTKRIGVWLGKLIDKMRGDKKNVKLV